MFIFQHEARRSIPGTAGGQDSGLLIVSHLALSSSLWGSAGQWFGAPPGGYRICLCLGENRGSLEQPTGWLVVPATSATLKSSSHLGATRKLFWAVGVAWAGGPLCTVLLESCVPSSRHRQPWAWGPLEPSQTALLQGHGPVQVACGVCL